MGLCALHTRGGIAVKRRAFLKTGAMLAAGATLAKVGAESAVNAGNTHEPGVSTAASQPDILLIITDQQVSDAVSALRPQLSDTHYLAHHVHTPNLDRLAAAGTTFLEHHVVNPVCSPSRACLFTGRMPVETGVIANNLGIDARLPNLGQWLGQAGPYRRYYCGKWHAGGPWNNPEPDGPRRIPGFETLAAGDCPTGDAMDPHVAASCEAFLQGDRDTRPFLLVANFMNPHDIAYWYNPALTAEGDPFSLQEEWPPLPPNFASHGATPFPLKRRPFSESQWRNYLYDYLRMVETVDQHVGRLLDAVAARSRPTLVIFTSDHGEGVGRHGLVSKWNPYQQAFKTPLIIAGPGVATGVVDRSHLASAVDLSTTICDYAGVPPLPDARGLSLRPLLEGHSGVQWRDHVYGELHHTGRMIRTARYKYVMAYRFSGDVALPFVSVRDGAATRFEPGRGDALQREPQRMLFDLLNDPWEMHNLAEDPQMAPVMTDHEELLSAWEQRLSIGEPHTIA